MDSASAPGLALSFFLLAAGISAQGNWSSLEAPEPRERHVMVFDASRNVVVRFGGSSLLGAHDDLAEWNGTYWREVLLPVRPSARDDSAFAYDRDRKVCVLFGGRAADGSALGDTWEYDGTKWTQRAPSASPAARHGHEMVYDAARKRMVLFGGVVTNQPYFGDTWEYDGTTWTQRAPTASPSARACPEVAYDAQRSRVVLFGGYDGNFRNDTWLYDGTTWTQAAPANMPPPTACGGCTYDTLRQRVLHWGGFGLFTVVWEWDGTDWSSLSPAYGPIGREYPALCYDEARNVSVLHGGGAATFVLADTWTWDAAGPQWTQRSGDALPIGRGGHAMAEQIDGGVLMYGGAGGHTDTWVFNGSCWVEMPATVNPGARDEHALATDTAAKRVVMFGGRRSGLPLGDTWEWDGKAWAQVFPQTAQPSPRLNHAMAFDAARNRVLLFGGRSGAGLVADTWEWNGMDWLRRTPASSPSPREGHAMAYDPNTQRVVLFGGFDGTSQVGDWWEWDGTNWTLRTVTGGPGARSEHAMAYDPKVKTVALFGGWDGTNVLNEHWEIGKQRTLTAPPAARDQLGMAYDTISGRLVQFGGIGTNGPLADTLRFDSGQLGSVFAYGTGCAGANGTPRISAFGGQVPQLGKVFQLQASPNSGNRIGVGTVGFSRTHWLAIPLPIDLVVIGAPGCLILCAYDLNFPIATTATKTVMSAPVPNDQAFLGVTFYAQILMTDPGANQLGLIVSDAAQCVVGQ